MSLVLGLDSISIYPLGALTSCLTSFFYIATFCDYLPACTSFRKDFLEEFSVVELLSGIVTQEPYIGQHYT